MTTSANAELHELKRELARLERGRGKRYAPEPRARFTAWGQRRRAEGKSWDQLGRELGVSAETLRRWCSGPAADPSRPVQSARLLPVQVVEARRAEPPDRVVSVSSPSGFRVEGLSLAEAAAMLRALA